MKMLNRLRIAYSILLLISFGCSQSRLGQNRSDVALSKREIYPGEKWETITDLKASGWSEEKLQKAAEYAESKNSAAYVVVHGGKIVQTFGHVDKKYKLHSVRKSLLSALYGIYVKEGVIDLEATLESLGIDDNEPGLSPEEKKATIHMLLKARSGIYHPALYETKAMAAARPARHSHSPGTFFYYNNWDFNALGTIFHQLTGKTVFAAFDDHIARPIGMEFYNPAIDGQFFEGPESIHPAYLFELTALDLARFGLLFARGGKWKNTQVVPEEWVKASVTPYSDAKSNGGYGYLWWVAIDGRHFGGSYAAPKGLFTARGHGGHVIAVLPDMDFVLVHRADTYVNDKRVSYEDVGYLLEYVLNAYEGNKQ